MAITDKINLDFQVFATGDPNLLIIVDTSVWGIIEDKPAIIEVTTPGTNKTYVADFEKGQVNVFNSSNLLISPIGVYNPLSDGLYRITLKGSPDSNCKHRDYLKTDNARLSLADMYIALGLENDPETVKLKEKLLDIKLLIEGAEACILKGKNQKGLIRLKRAIDDLKEFENCQTCD